MTHNVDYRSLLLEQFELLKTQNMFQCMYQTVENSPWHRESNVGVHTEMVMSEYVNSVDASTADRIVPTWTRNDYLGGIAAAFHDTGKPASEIIKHSEARGTYRAYHGHELLSARLFETYACDQVSMFSADEVAAVSFIIEHHMPWDIKDASKRRNLAMTAELHGGVDVFTRHLLADQYGRTSDDQVAKKERADIWATEFIKLADTVQGVILTDTTLPTFWMPVAPSGAGKSTYLSQLRTLYPDINVFSLDLLRHEFYDTVDYLKAYTASVEDPTFSARATARFHAQVKEHRPMYIDNTNLSAKRRRMYLDAAIKNNYNTQAVLMPISLTTLLNRRTTRQDKTIPLNAVIQHYNSLQTPTLGEFNKIVVSNHNMVKL